MPLRGADVAESKKQIHCRLARKATAEGAVAIYVSWCARSKNERCHRDPPGVAFSTPSRPEDGVD